MNLFLDTNAVIKLYHKETGTDNLLNFIQKYSDNLIISISDLTKIEFHSTFLKKVRTSEIDLLTVNEINETFDSDIKLFNIVEVDRIVKNFAINLLDSIGGFKNLRTLDAIQLSSAIILNQFIPIDYFICSDKKLLEIAQDFFPIVNPENN